MKRRGRGGPRQPGEYELPPYARRMVLSLRDMGYDFEQAVADIVDNSIEAHAHEVQIEIEFDSRDSWVSISDDGRGMTAEEVREAMRFGAEREYGEEDLGKFGLGMKTASFSQCKRLTVASRASRERSRVSAYKWDLEHITKTNRWALQPVNLEELPSPVRDSLETGTGTIVLWQRLDRILGLKYPQGETARRRLAQMCRDLETHLGMVFHRFLAGDIPRRRLRIAINGNNVSPWDPFCRGEAGTKHLKRVEFTTEGETYSGRVTLDPFILPAQDAFSSAAAFKAATGPANWNQQQGFYIYRANRMIQAGGWCHFRAPDEHTKLARIALDFTRDLDEAFKLNVPKMRVILPSELRGGIGEAIVPIVSQARQTYDKGRKRSGSGASGGGTVPRGADSEAPAAVRFPAPEISTVPLSSKTDPSSIGNDGGEEVLTFDEWTERVIAAAEPSELHVLRTIVARVRPPPRNTRLPGEGLEETPT